MFAHTYACPHAAGGASTPCHAHPCPCAAMRHVPCGPLPRMPCPCPRHAPCAMCPAAHLPRPEPMSSTTLRWSSPAWLLNASSTSAVPTLVIEP